MRNARIINELVITSDNSAAIGQKELDVVKVPDEVTSYFSTRVTLLEQLASHALPLEIILLNFSGEAAWARYVKGIEKVFRETDLPLPSISGSTESNMPTMQSGFGITMIGQLQKKQPSLDQLLWYTYGRPLVGNELLAHQDQVADLKELVMAYKSGMIIQVVPVGSKGVKHELQQLIALKDTQLDSLPYDVNRSAGPSTIVIFAVAAGQKETVEKKFGLLLSRVK